MARGPGWCLMVCCPGCYYANRCWRAVFRKCRLCVRTECTSESPCRVALWDHCQLFPAAVPASLLFPFLPSLPPALQAQLSVGITLATAGR